MNDNQLDQIFTAIKTDFNRFEEKIDNGFTKADAKYTQLLDSVEQIARTTATILEIVQTNDLERKEMKASIKELDRRITRLEKSIA